MDQVNPGERFRLVALDIDGTVVTSTGEVTGRLIDVLARLAARGVRTVLCTGRRLRSSMPVLEELGHVHPVLVCSGGALIKRVDDEKTLYADPLERGVARRAVELYREHDLVPFLLYDRSLDEPELRISATQRERAEQMTYTRANREAVQWYDGSYPEELERALEVYTVDDAERVRRAAGVGEALRQDAIVECMVQQRYGGELAMEVRCPTATKWRALEWLLGQWEIEPEEVVAIGDDVNDLPVLRAVGRSFAMGNASPEVKEAADALTAGNDEDGVAEALESVFPCNWKR